MKQNMMNVMTTWKVLMSHNILNESDSKRIYGTGVLFHNTICDLLRFVYVDHR